MNRYVKWAIDNLNEDLKNEHTCFSEYQGVEWTYGKSVVHNNGNITVILVPKDRTLTPYTISLAKNSQIYESLQK